MVADHLIWLTEDCPECLVGTFVFGWRVMAMSDSCEQHNPPLDKCCPICLSPVIEYRHGVLSRWGSDTQAECRSCGTCWFVKRRELVLMLEAPCACCGRSDD